MCTLRNLRGKPPGKPLQDNIPNIEQDEEQANKDKKFNGQRLKRALKQLRKQACLALGKHWRDLICDKNGVRSDLVANKRINERAKNYEQQIQPYNCQNKNRILFHAIQ